MGLTKIDISSRNKVDIGKHYFDFSMLQLKRSGDKRMLFFFYNQISFSFSFTCTCFMGTFQKTEYNLICKLLTEAFLIPEFHIPVLIYFGQREKPIL